ncbi:MAG: OmpA family protein [Vicingaceae bacterium]
MEYQPSNTQVLRHSLKNIGLLLIVQLLFSCTALSQSLTTSDKRAAKAFEKAQEFYQKHQYKEAKEEVNEALERDPNFVEALTIQAYIAMDEADYATAKESFSKAVSSNPEAIPNNLFFLAGLELKDGEYSKAEEHYKLFLNSSPANQGQANRAKDALNNIEFALDAMTNPVEFKPKNLGPEINSEYPEYFPCLTVDNQTILFTRRLPAPNTPIGFNEDFFIAKKENSNWKTAVNLGAPINTGNNEGAPSLSADGQLLIFTACELYGDYGGERRGAGSCDLFYSTKEGPAWTRPINLGQAINSQHWETQPSFSADGKTLYFVRGKRNRNGSRTGDIYMTQLNEENYWSKPIKLNRNINTNGNEESVFIHPDGKTLYFSSDGHLGMGGLDIFISRKDSSGEWGKAINLGFPINTHKNENSLLISADGTQAYFASDREEGYGDLDLYSFELPEQFKPQQVTYFAGKIFDQKTKAPLSARFELINLENGELVVESYSDPVDGSFLVSLPDGKEYALNASKSGYLFYSDNFNLKNKKKDEPYKKNVPLHPINVGEKIILRNIFFETAKYELKKESKIELNKLVQFLEKNPSIKIEVSGHTDNVGSQESNLVLSKNRANAVVEYLVKNEIEASRIESKGYGSSLPIDDNSTAEGRAKNRRTEFKILTK